MRDIPLQEVITAHTDALAAHAEDKPWGLKEFFVCDPYRNLILFAERLSEEEARSVQEA
jgi:hypothetical protein